MRLFGLALVATMVSVGCGSVGPDMTMNMVKPGDEKYPAGPYGYVQDETIENITFVGKRDPAGAAGTASYDTLAMEKITLGMYHNDPNVKFLAISGNAGWCGPCNAEQMYTNGLQEEYEPRGVRFFQALIQGFDARTGAPAKEEDINRWQDRHDIHVGIGLDPEDQIHKFADVAAFPLNMVVRTTDMKIVFMSVGGQNLDPILADLVP